MPIANGPLRIGIVGAGANTRAKHIPGLQAIEGVQIVGVCNRTADSSRSVAREFNIPRIYRHWKEVTSDPNLHAVVIGTWPYLHGRATVAALDSGKHVLCEARMASDLGEARAMLDAAHRHPELVAQVVPSPFTLEVDDTIVRLISEGFLGRIAGVELRACMGFADEEAPITWRQQRRYSGVNILSLGIWYEAIVRWIGPARKVTALAKTSVPMRPDDAGRCVAVDVPDHLGALAEMVCGAQANMLISAVAGHGGPPEVYLYGTEGTLLFARGKLHGGRRGEHSLHEIAIDEGERGGWRVEEEFVGAIRGEEPVRRTTFEDGYAYMQFTQAVADSLATGQTIAL
jgi:predicted dehydrogenase